MAIIKTLSDLQATGYRLRKSHEKSRNGCLRCKQLRKKVLHYAYAVIPSYILQTISSDCIISATKPDRDARDAPDCRIHANINIIRVPADQTQSRAVCRIQKLNSQDPSQ